MRYRLEIPSKNGADAVRRFVASWLDQPALRALVEHEGGRWPDGDLVSRVEALHAFSDRWDFRGGAERLDIVGRASGAEPAFVLDRGVELGLASADAPTERSYDHALVLGGTALASIYRIQTLFEMRAAGVTVGDAGVLTALRPTTEAELDLVRERPAIAAILPPETENATEFDIMVRAVEHFAAASATVTRQSNANPNLASATAIVGDLTVLAAPSADPDRRANTGDNYSVYADRVVAGDSVLVVTSSIYLPYQFFIALQALGWEQPKTIEATGFPPEWMDGVLTGAENVLQELRSALFAARGTLQALGDSA